MKEYPSHVLVLMAVTVCFWERWDCECWRRIMVVMFVRVIMFVFMLMASMIMSMVVVAEAEHADQINK